MTEQFTRRDTLGGALATAVLLAAPARAVGVGVGWAEVDRLARAMTVEHIVPGVSIAASRAGRLTYGQGFGMANLETGTPVTPESVFHIGSITKQFTAAAIVLLAADGKLALDDKLSRFFPQVPRANEITLRQMLTHTAGLGNYTDRKPLLAFLVSSRLDYDRDALLADMLAHTDPFFIGAPGAQWAYSNTGYVLLGLIVEKVSAIFYGAFFKQRLFAPAGLTQTSVDDLSVVVPHRASGYSGHAGSDTAFDNAAYISMTYPGGAGSMRSTPRDLCRWHTALLGGRILPPNGLKAMLTPVRLANGAQPIAIQGSGGPKPVSYGFGIELKRFEGHATVEHGGGIFGFASDLRSFPVEQVSVAMVVNFDGQGHPSFPKRFTALKDAAARAALAA